MVFSWLNRSKTRYLALDIGSQNTKIMLFTPGTACIDKMLIKPTPLNAFETGTILDESILIDFLTQCMGEMDLDSEFKVIASISGKSVIAKKIDIPKMEETLIYEYVEMEAEQELFYDKAEMELDYNILHGVNFKNPEEQSVIVVTVSKQTIENYNNLLQKTFLGSDILDTNFVALFNSFEHNNKISENNNYLLLDIGCKTTTLVVTIKNQVVFARNLPIGGDFFTQEIQKNMSLSYQEAEEIKVSASSGQIPEAIASLIKEKLNGILSEEVTSCYKLYQSLFPEQHIEYCCVTGGASSTLGLVSHLEEELEVPMKIFDPFKNMSFLNPSLESKKEDFKLFSAVLTGLSLRASND